MTCAVHGEPVNNFTMDAQYCQYHQYYVSDWSSLSIVFRSRNRTAASSRPNVRMSTPRWVWESHIEWCLDGSSGLQAVAMREFVGAGPSHSPDEAARPAAATPSDDDLVDSDDGGGASSSHGGWNDFEQPSAGCVSPVNDGPPLEHATSVLTHDTVCGGQASGAVSDQRELGTSMLSGAPARASEGIAPPVAAALQHGALPTAPHALSAQDLSDVLGSGDDDPFESSQSTPDLQPRNEPRSGGQGATTTCSSPYMLTAAAREEMVASAAEHARLVKPWLVIVGRGISSGSGDGGSVKLGLPRGPQDLRGVVTGRSRV